MGVFPFSDPKFTPSQLPESVFQQAIEHAAGGLVICDVQQPSWPIVYASPGFERLTGYKAEDVLGKSCQFLQGEETEQIGLQEIREAIATGASCKVLLRNYRKGGQAFWNEVTLSPIVDMADQVTHYVGTQVDISHYLDTFNALQQSEIRYRRLYEETPAMMHSVDGNGLVTSISHYWLEKLGYSRGDVMGKPLASFLAADSQTQIDEILAAIATQTVDRDRLCQFLKKDGTPIDVLLSTMAESDNSPQSDSTLGVLVDVTERKKAKEKLRRSEALLRAINNLPPTGIFVMDCHTNEALFINAEFYRIWQLEHLQSAVDTGELNGEQLLTECLSNIDLGQFVATSTAKDFTHGNKIVEDEVPLLDGRTLRRIYGPIQENNSTFAYLYIFEDITERKQAVTALANATEAAKAANKAKSEFLANMSHELRSPLHAILGFTHILKTTSPRPEQKENLDIICRSSEHLLALINDILDISKIEAGRVVLTHSEFDIYRLLDELQQMFSRTISEKNLQLVVDRSYSLPRVIYSDRLKLRQILINLLSNAVKFTEDGSITLAVSTSAVSPSVTSDNSESTVASSESSMDDDSKVTLTFSITDTGTGIAPNDQTRLFEAFVQTESGLTAHEGTGLGLTISYEYIQLLGGELTVRSSLGKGSTFAFSIEVNAVEGVSIEPELELFSQSVVGLAPGQPDYRILVVDDVALNRKLLTHLLRESGFEVREAENGEDAIALWKTWHPQLIWMDVRMPVMGGEEATRQIRISERTREKTAAMASGTCIIALTANAFDDDRAAALASGCDDFVSKPIQAQEIFDKMAQHLDVRYEYAKSERLAEPINQPLTTDLFANTPPEWRYHLTQATLDLDDDAILGLVSQLPPEQQPLAAAIEKQVNSLAYKKLLQVLQEADAVSP
ncbi:MAG: PAS domain S-box protein [Cyanobacteria bacterium P01_C01_bin.69]